jgi:hypothetical protein
MRVRVVSGATTERRELDGGYSDRDAFGRRAAAKHAVADYPSYGAYGGVAYSDIPAAPALPAPPN